MSEIAEMKIEAQIELGVMFATVRASFIDGYRLVGAHVDLDGNILGDTGLVETRIDAAVDGERNGAVRALRQAAAVAVMNAHRECGIEYTVRDSTYTLEIVARALPYDRTED